MIFARLADRKVVVQLQFGWIGCSFNKNEGHIMPLIAKGNDNRESFVQAPLLIGILRVTGEEMWVETQDPSGGTLDIALSPTMIASVTSCIGEPSKIVRLQS